jgi:hypothetical protein
MSFREGSVKAKLFSAIVLVQVVLTSATAWADDDGYVTRPHVSDIGGDDHSPGVTLVIFATLLLIGFGIGLTVGRRTRRK